MHAAEHRALRELEAALRHLAEHWAGLAGRLDGVPVLGAGAHDARTAADELAAAAAARDLAVRPAAQGLGAVLGGTRRGVADRFLERNQALRLGVLDVSHAVTLLDYVAALARRRGDEQLGALATRWGDRLREHERAARGAVVALGGEPDAAVRPLDASPAGRAAHRVALAGGSLGEWLDRRLPGD